IDRGAKPGFARAPLELAAVALGHVDAAEEEQRSLVDSGQRRARPRDDDPAAALRHPTAVDLLWVAPRDHALDLCADVRHVRRGDVALPEDVRPGLVGLVSEEALEGDVRRLVLYQSAVVDQTQDA